MEFIRNYAAPRRVRRETVDGREYIVANVVMIAGPMVMSGSKGPLFYESNETCKAKAQWEGKPVTYGHPFKLGQVSTAADTPEVQVGTVRNVSCSQGRLTADAWIDTAKLRWLDPEMLSDLASGRKVEVSTGLFTDNEPAQNGAKFNGRSFTHYARNHQPDHLALLPRGQRGACSADDGCGLLANRLPVSVTVDGPTDVSVAVNSFEENEMTFLQQLGIRPVRNRDGRTWDIHDMDLSPIEAPVANVQQDDEDDWRAISEATMHRPPVENQQQAVTLNDPMTAEDDDWAAIARGNMNAQ